MRRRILIGLLMCAAIVKEPSVDAADLERGKLLHDNHCRMCHDSIAYKRSSAAIADYAQIRAQVVRWQSTTGLRWSEEDIDNVTAYLAHTYYKLTVPTK
jgi:mono/diheme cytochrome c family protein